MGKKAKRRFERRAKLLIDEWEPGSCYSPARVDSRRERIAEEGALKVARAEPTEVLIARIESETASGAFYLRDDRCAVRAIVERAAEPDVRARVAALFARGPHETDLAKMLARAFGAESRTWLLARIEPYLASPIKLGRERAWMCMRTAEVLLAVDPQESRASAFLVALFDHDDSGTRQFAIWNAVHVYLAASEGSGLRRSLSDGLARLQDSKIDEAFVEGLPALLSIDHASALARASALLLDGETASHVRMDVAGHLVHDRWPYRNLPVVLRWMGDGATLRERVDVAVSIAPVLPPQWLSRTVASALDDESPSLRDWSRRLFEWLPRARARVLIQRALRDEPDPYLKRAFRDDLRNVSGAGPSPKHARKPGPGRRRKGRGSD